MNRYKKANEGIHAPEEAKEKAARSARSRRRPWMGAAAALLAVVLIGGTFWSGWRNGFNHNPNQTPIQGRTVGLFPSASASTLAEAEYPSERIEQELTGDLDGFLTTSIPQFLGGAGEANRVYSPLNVYMALAMLAETSDGNSRRQILDLLGADSIDTLRRDAAALWNNYYQDDTMRDGLAISVMANSLWLRGGLDYNLDTLNTLAKSYRASSFSGEMGSAEYNQALQSWVNEQTRGVLAEQAGGLSFEPETVLGLVSTLYFKSSWSSPFSPELNTTGVFHTPSGDMETEYMHSGAWFSTDYYWGEHFSAISLGFQEWLYEMWLILPDEGYTTDQLLEDGEALEFLLYDTKSGLYHLETNEITGAWPNCEYVKVNLTLPKFDVSSELDLIGGLTALGVTDVFDPSASNFDPLGVDASIFVSKAEHAARVMIDEEGCTAASYVDLELFGGGGPPDEVVDFTLDRPFLFAITGTNELPLFIGIVNQPNG